MRPAACPVRLTSAKTGQQYVTGYVMNQATYYIRDGICCLSPIKRNAGPVLTGRETGGSPWIRLQRVAAITPARQLQSVR